MTDASSAPIILVAIVVLWGFVVALSARVGALQHRLRQLSQIDAKVDALLTHAGITFDPFGNVPPEVSDAVRRGKKIDAIKAYRAATGADLRDAKEYVEELQRRAQR
ncbi:MAG TPA: hypothetical protein VH740_18485 [Vicinamibacterales bacterium]|jgi:ribosomal protein L7/L12